MAMKERFIECNIFLTGREPLRLILDWRTPSEIANDIAHVVHRYFPDADVALDLDPETFRLTGTGAVVAPSRRHLGHIKMARQVGRQAA